MRLRDRLTFNVGSLFGVVSRAPKPKWAMAAVAFFAFAIGTTASAQVPVLYYDFENNATRTIFENLVEQSVNAGSGALTKAGGGAIGGVGGAGTFNGGAATGQGLTSNTWDPATADPLAAATHYYQFVVNTTGFADLSVSFDSQASSTGPARVGALFSTDGVTFSGTATAIVTSATFTGNSKTFSFGPGADNQPTVTVRIYAFAGSAADRATAPAHGAFAGTGTFRVDNLTVAAKAVTASKTLLNYPAIGLSIRSGTAFTPTYADFALNGPAINVSLASDLNLSGILTLTNGTLTTAANTLALTSGATVSGASGLSYVIGNLRKDFAANGSKVFEVGSPNGYSPFTANVTAGTPGNITCTAVQGPQPNMNPAASIQRYWDPRCDPRHHRRSDVPVPPRRRDG